MDCVEKRKYFCADTGNRTIEVRGINAVFVGFDKDGQARSGFQRGLTTNAERPFKHDVDGSVKEYAFCIKRKVTDKYIDAHIPSGIERIKDRS